MKKYSRVSFDTIVLSNVLEHIEKDEKALKLCYEILRKKHGKLLLIVPAHKFLYGPLDAETGHFRRYEKADIIRLARLCKFKILDLYAFNFAGIFGWFVNYCLLKRKNTNNSPKNLQFGFFDRFIARPSRFIESRVRPKIGLSLVAILEAGK